MNDFFKFYSGSLSGTIIVIILFLFIRFLLRKQSNHIKIMLWVILLIRLLFPVSIYTEYGILYSETFVEKNENLSAQEMKSDNSLQILPKDENTSTIHGKKEEYKYSYDIVVYRSFGFCCILYYTEDCCL